MLTARQDPIARMAFAAVPTTTAINYSTLCHERMDILVGFNTGDIFWIEAFSGRYTRYNKDASSMAQTLSNNKSISVVSSAPVKKVQWLQGDQLFATAFQDGCIAFWDKDREDPNSFTPSPGCAPDAGPSSAVLQPVLSRYSSHLDGNSESHETNGDDASAARQSSYRRHTQSREQLEERTDDIIVTVPQLANEKDKKAAKINPIAHWKVSRKPITGSLRLHALIFAADKASTHRFRNIARQCLLRRSQRGRLPAHNRLQLAKAARHLRGVLWRTHLRLLVTRWALRIDGRAG